jgi:hypothetical protein
MTAKASATALRMALFVAVACAGTAACVTGPLNNEAVNPHQKIHFSGYAATAGAAVQVKALNKKTGAWDVVATFTAAPTPDDVAGDDLYFWHGDVEFSTIAGWRCYWGSSLPGLACSIPPGLATARVRVHTGDITLTTFEADGHACLLRKFEEGKGGLVAGNECRSPASPVLTLRWNT